MSSNARGPAEKTDRRVLRTRERLGDALIALIQEQPFEAITVQDVLDRAGVSRATFYVHYRDKSDLFVSDLDEFLEQTATALARAGDRSDRVAPVRELFAHVAAGRRLWTALAEAGRIQDFIELGQAHFARAIDRRLAERPLAAALSAAERAVMAQGFAGALLSLLIWWLDRGSPESPAEMDDLFHRMVWRGVRA